MPALPDLHAGVVFLGIDRWFDSKCAISITPSHVWWHFTHLEKKVIDAHINAHNALTLSRHCINSSLGCTRRCTCCHTLTLSRRDTVSITQYFRCQSCVACHAPWVAGGERRLAAEDREGHSLIRPSRLSIPPLGLSLASLWVCVNFWFELASSATITCTSLPLIFTTYTHQNEYMHIRLVFSTFCRLHLKASISRRTTYTKTQLHNPQPVPEYWPKLSPCPAPLTPLSDRGSMMGT